MSLRVQCVTGIQCALRVQYVTKKSLESNVSPCHHVPPQNCLCSLFQCNGNRVTEVQFTLEGWGNRVNQELNLGVRVTG